MIPKKILVVPKTTTLDAYKQEYPYFAYVSGMKDRFRDILMKRNLNADDMFNEDQGHYETLAFVTKLLDKHKLNYTMVNTAHLDKSDFKDVDLVMPIGGDGTILFPAHYVFDDTPFMGVNSYAGRSKGYWMSSNIENVEANIEKLLKDNYSLSPIRRMEVRVFNDEQHYGLALNEVAFGKFGFAGCRYHISSDKFREHQQGSGLVISLAEGASGWLNNIYRRESFEGHEKELQFVNREPREFGKNYEHNQAFAKEFKIESDDTHAVISLDSNNDKFAFPIERGQYAIIKVSDKPLYMVKFR